MRHGETGWRNQNGMSLIETMLVVVLIGIVTLIGTQGIDFYQRYELQSASRQLFGTIEKVRQDAMTKRTPTIQSRGFGLRLTGLAPNYTGYTTFEFDDIDNDFVYDGTGEEFTPTGPNLFSRSIIVTSNTTGTSPNVLLYDDRGLSRSTNGASGIRTHWVDHGSLPTPRRCVVVGTIRIREGVWNASTGECD